MLTSASPGRDGGDGEFGADALTKRLAEVMTREVVTCGEAETAVSIMERMTVGKFRHIPVIERDRQGRASFGRRCPTSWPSGRPIQAEKSRPLANAAPLPIAATIALETIGPMPGTVMTLRQLLSLFAKISISSVIDPTKVVRIALQDGASIAGLLITTEAMVAEKPKKEAPMPAMHPGAAWITDVQHARGPDNATTGTGRDLGPGLEGGSKGIARLCGVKLTSLCRVNAVRFARDITQTGAPGEIRTPDPQIRILVLSKLRNTIRKPLVLFRIVDGSSESTPRKARLLLLVANDA